MKQYVLVIKRHLYIKGITYYLKFTQNYVLHFFKIKLRFLYIYQLGTLIHIYTQTGNIRSDHIKLTWSYMMFSMR